MTAAHLRRCTPSFSSARARLTRAAVVLLVAAGLVPATVGAASPAQADDHCEPVAVLAFRGSGEGNVTPSVTSAAGREYQYPRSDLITNGWEGPMLQHMLSAFSTTRTGTFRADQVPVIPVGPPDATTRLGYPAIAAGWEAFSQLNGSAEKGVAAAEAAITRFKRAHSAGCAAPTKFIATGYSQGAMAARLLAQQNTVDVVAVVNVGDPYQKGGSAGNTGTGAGGNGFMRWNYPWYQSRWDPFYDLGIHKSALCHRDDLICDFRWGTFWRLTATQHTNYMQGDHAGEAQQRATELANLAREITEDAASATPPPRSPADVVFAVDTTGSMSPYIEQAVATAQAAAEATLRAATGSRVGLVEYRDHGDEFVARVVVPLTSDYGRLTSGLGGLAADGGGDWPEAVYSGILTAAEMDFRAAAARSIVLLGDAPAQDPEPLTGYTAATVVARLGGTPLTGARAMERIPEHTGSTADREALADVQGEPAAPAAPRGGTADAVARSVEEPVAAAESSSIVLYSLAADRALSDQLAPVVAATGGLSFDLDDASGVSAALESALEDSLGAPVAHLGVSPSATVGIQTSVSAAGSSSADPELRYEFDLDGDGTFEADTTEGVATVVFDTPGPHPVAVRVTDSRGRTSTATSTVDVAPVEATVPQLDLEAPALTVRLASTSVRAGESLGLTVTADDVTGAAFLLVPGDDPWALAPAVELDPLRDGWQDDGVALPGELPAGTYQVVVGLPDGRFGVAPVTVLAAEPTDPTPDPDPGPGPVIDPVTPAVPVSHPVTPTAPVVDPATFVPAAPEPVAPVRRTTLARTGGDGTAYALLAGSALVLVLIGGSMSRAARRRRT